MNPTQPTQAQIDALYKQAQGVSQKIQDYAKANPQNPASAGVLANPAGAQTSNPSNPFKIEVPEVLPSQALSGGSSVRSVLNNRNSMETMFSNFLQEQQKLRESLTAAVPKNITEARQAATDLKNLIDEKEHAFRRRVEEIERSQGGTVSGVQSAVRAAEIEHNRELADLSVRYNAQVNNLQTQLDDYKLGQDNLRTVYELNKDTLSTFKTLQELTRPDVIKTDVNKETGDVIAFTQDPSTGEIVSQVVGNIGADAKEQYIDMKHYDTGSQLIWYAVKPDNTVVTRVIANTGGGGGTIGGGFDGGSQYQSDLDAIVGAVISTIPSKFGQEQFASQLTKARNDEDRINLVAAQVLKNAPAEYKNDFRNQAVGVSMLDKAIAELDSGVQTGLLKNTLQYTFNVFGKDFDPNLAKINGYITSAIQPYRNSVTGAAWGDQEDAEYQQLFGSTKYSPAELRQRLVQTKELLKTKSAEGLNAFVNPLGQYDNAFQTGGLAPLTNTSTQPISEPVQSWWSSLGTWLFGSN